MQSIRTHYWPSLTTYDAVATYFTRASRKKGSPMRYLGRSSQRDLLLEPDVPDPRGGPAGISARYHRTRVVTWYPDNSVLLRFWESRNTALLLNSFFMGHLNARCTLSSGHSAIDVYDAPDRPHERSAVRTYGKTLWIQYDPTHRRCVFHDAAEALAPWRRWYLNRKDADQTLAQYALPDMTRHFASLQALRPADYRTLYVLLGIPQEPIDASTYMAWSFSLVLQLVEAGPAGWTNLYARYGRQAMEIVRNALYARHADTVFRTEEALAIDPTAVTTWLNGEQRWARVVKAHPTVRTTV